MAKRTNIRNLNEKHRKVMSLIWIEVILVLFPIGILLYSFAKKDKLSELIYAPEWSLATVMLSIQTIIRFASGLLEYTGSKSSMGALLYIVIIIFILFVIPLLTFAEIQIGGNLSLWRAIIQVLLFFVSIFAFMVFGGVGENLKN
jgi:hypothetical protein